MWDKDQIKSVVDIGAVIEQDLGPPVKRHGSWLFWFCPFHNDGRNPNFSANLQSGTFKCFSGQCGAYGDIFDYRQKRYQENFFEALSYFQRQLGRDPENNSPHPLIARQQVHREPHAEPPEMKWQQRAWEYICWAQGQLWSTDAGRAGLAELVGVRGLNLSTIREWQLGFNPQHFHDRAESWGRTGKGIWLAGGIVIPCIVEEEAWYIKTRIFEDGQPVGRDYAYGKYTHVSGGKGALFGADRLGDHDRLLLAEGELDMLLAWQEGREILDVATLAGAGKRLNSRWLPYLLTYQEILLAYDNDQAGQAGSRKLQALGERLRLFPPPGEGDICDYYNTTPDGKILGWLRCALDTVHA